MFAVCPARFGWIPFHLSLETGQRLFRQESIPQNVSYTSSIQLLGIRFAQNLPLPWARECERPVFDRSGNKKLIGERSGLVGQIPWGTFGAFYHAATLFNPPHNPVASSIRHGGQRARLNIFRASFSNAALALDLPNPFGTNLYAICSKVSFG
jgi:hypothetical protein